MKFIYLTLFACLMAGCATQERTYYWGDYEALLYEMYNKPGSADPQLQIAKLTSDIQQAGLTGKAVPPGVHAHLAMMYAMVGNVSQSQAAFLMEKQLFPESAVLIDGMMQRAQEASTK